MRDNTPEWLWKPHSLTLSFIFSLASEIVRDWRADVDVSAGSEDDPEEPHLHRLFCIIFKIHHLKLNYSFLSDFFKFIWTLHWHVKKSVHTALCNGAKLLTQAENYVSKCYLPQGKRLTFLHEKLSGIFLQDWESFPSILSDIWNRDPAMCWNDKRPGAVPLWSLFGRRASASLAMPDVLVK